MRAVGGRCERQVGLNKKNDKPACTRSRNDVDEMNESIIAFSAGLPQWGIGGVCAGVHSPLGYY